MQAIILAAGMGKRLRSYTKDATKCMVKVNGKTLIEYTIEALVSNHIERLVVVVGYKGQLLKDFIASKFNAANLHGMKIEYIENPVYDTTNNIYSLYLAGNELAKDDTILLESDLIFKPEILTALITSPDKNLAVVSPFESWMDGTCTLWTKIAISPASSIKSVLIGRIPNTTTRPSISINFLKSFLNNTTCRFWTPIKRLSVKMNTTSKF